MGRQVWRWVPTRSESRGMGVIGKEQQVDMMRSEGRGWVSAGGRLSSRTAAGPKKCEGKALVGGGRKQLRERERLIWRWRLGSMGGQV